MKDKKHKLIIFDEYTGNIELETDPDSLTSMLIRKEELRKKYQIKKDNLALTNRFGGKIFVFQYILQRASFELKPESLRLFSYLMGTCDFENWIEVNQSDIAKQLKTSPSNISRAMKQLKEKEYVQIIKKGTKNYYRINPEYLWKGSFESWKKVIEIKDFKKD